MSFRKGPVQRKGVWETMMGYFPESCPLVAKPKKPIYENKIYISRPLIREGSKRKNKLQKQRTRTGLPERPDARGRLQNWEKVEDISG